MNQSLGEFLGATNPLPDDGKERNEYKDLADLTGADFAKGVLESREFRQYIMDGIVLRDLAPGIITRLMDHGWGKPPDKVELTGKDGQPLEAVTEVRWVVMQTPARSDATMELRQVTH